MIKNITCKSFQYYWNVNKDTTKFKNTITQELPEIKFKWKSFPD